MASLTVLKGAPALQIISHCLSDTGVQVVKIADFGISKMLSGGAAAEDLLETAGTPAFMCPEICAGEPYSGPAADVWALGATAFMLGSAPTIYIMTRRVSDHRLRCGRPPFIADRVVALYRAILEDAVDFPVGGPGPGLRRLLMRMLEKRPALRVALGTVLVFAASNLEAFLTT